MSLSVPVALYVLAMFASSPVDRANVADSGQRTADKTFLSVMGTWTLNGQWEKRKDGWEMGSGKTAGLGNKRDNYSCLFFKIKNEIVE